MRRYPVLLSIPHGGDRIPPEVDAYTQLSAHDLLADSDAFTREIYAISDEVAYVAEASIARAFVDLSRPVTALPPEQPDGVIKSHTCHGVPVYRDALWRDQALVDALTHDLLTKYYYPYHRTLETRLAQSDDLALMIDCHSMEAVGPKIGPDCGVARPTICLGTRFGESCSASIARHMAHALRRAFGLRADQITIDEPFAGGYIIRHYGHNPLPCLQIELNRGLYLDQTREGRWRYRINQEKIAQMRQQFSDALALFFA